MQNLFKNSDDGVKTDEADREHAGGSIDVGSDAATEAETKDASYRDDPSDFAASSDYAQRGTTNQYSGQSPGDESGNFGGGRESRGMHSGSQEQWRGASASAAAAGGDAEAAPKDGDARDDVASRNADPGQSSFGGFRDEDPSPHDAPQQKGSAEHEPSKDGSARKP